MISSCSRRMSARARPSRTPALASRRALPTMRLPAVSATMSSDSRMGTPASISDANVCEKRASATLWISCPKIGGLSLNASHFRRPALGLDPAAEQHDRGRRSRRRRGATTGLRTILEMSMMIRVGVGSLACSDANSFCEHGHDEDEQRQEDDDHHGHDDGGVGHGRPDACAAAPPASPWWRPGPAGPCPGVPRPRRPAPS